MAKLLGKVLAYLWSGWGAVASLLLFCALWELGHQLYASFILPSPQQTFSQLWQMLAQSEVQQTIGLSAWRAMLGFALAVIVGSLLGMLAGLFVTAGVIMRPLITILLGMPPVAWLVLAMIWFGLGNATPIFTVFIASVPLVFLSAMQGARTMEQQLKDVAKSLRLPLSMRLYDLYLPHMLSYLFPGWIMALGSSWKVVIMAEMLASDSGIGAALAISRGHLDMTRSLAWVLAALLILLAVEYLVFEPIKRYVEGWRVV